MNGHWSLPVLFVFCSWLYLDVCVNFMAVVLHVTTGSEAEPFKFNMLVESKNRRQSCSCECTSADLTGHQYSLFVVACAASLTHLNNDALMASSSKRGMVLPSVPQWTEFLFESSSIAASDRSRSASEATTSSSVFAVPSIHDGK